MIDDSDVMKFLDSKFRGVAANQDAVLKRFNDYVKLDFSNYLLDLSLPYIKKTDKVLDVGSGFGSYIFLLKKEGIDACGIEIQDFLVDYARQRISENLDISASDAESTYIKGSAFDMSYDENTFDVVTVWNVLEHVGHYKQLIQEVSRVLKPGGKLFILNVNYASCFIEPHYRVPWLPIMPRGLASKYLSALGRDPSYFNTGIFYVSNSALLRTLKKNNLSFTSHYLEKLSDLNLVGSDLKKKIILLAKRFGFLSLIKLFYRIKLRNPLISYIDIIATKKQ